MYHLLQQSGFVMLCSIPGVSVPIDILVTFGVFLQNRTFPCCLSYARINELPRQGAPEQEKIIGGCRGVNDDFWSTCKFRWMVWEKVHMFLDEIACCQYIFSTLFCLWMGKWGWHDDKNGPVIPQLHVPFPPLFPIFYCSIRNKWERSEHKWIIPVLLRDQYDSQRGWWSNKEPQIPFLIFSCKSPSSLAQFYQWFRKIPLILIFQPSHHHRQSRRNGYNHWDISEISPSIFFLYFVQLFGKLAPELHATTMQPSAKVCAWRWIFQQVCFTTTPKTILSPCWSLHDDSCLSASLFGTLRISLHT